MAIQFTEKDHKYKSIDPSQSINWISVTSFVGAFKTPFNQREVAEKASSKKNSKWYGLPVDQIISIWNKETERAVTLGSWYHNEREADVIACETLQRDGIDLPIIRPIFDGEIKIAPDQNLTQGIYPEHMVYLQSAGLCGQADRVEIVNNHIDIYDYKTNKKIDFESYVNWEGVSKKMLGPISHLDDCNFNHYALQLSTYMYIIARHNFNLKPRKMQIHHITFKIESEDEFGYPITATDPNGNPIIDKVVPYDVPYLKTEVKNMIDYLKDNPELVLKK
jgi:hypothetical protein